MPKNISQVECKGEKSALPIASPASSSDLGVSHADAAANLPPPPAPKMASLPRDLTHILVELASRLACAGSGSASYAAGDSLSVSISSLAAALNPAANASGGTGVLDAALSLMCFDPQEVDRARVDCLVRTIVSALSASVSCRVVRPDDCGVSTCTEMLYVGSSVSRGDCRELVRSCAALVDKLGDRDVSGRCYDLLYAAVKVALLSPRYQCLFPLPYYREDGENISEMGIIATDLTSHPSYQVLPGDGSIPLRALLWHLDPSILRHDLSAMLQEVSRRPLLCLRKELHDRVAWRTIVICLVCSPPAFLEMTSLFHTWFLVTGLGPVLELCTAMVSSALDVLFEPMAWGISMELGKKFPFTHAYFCERNDLLAILNGPISCRRFLHLVSYMDAMIHLGKTGHSSLKNMQSQQSKGLVKFKYGSAWSMITNFPSWFNFATALLFHRKGSRGYLSEILSKEITSESISATSLTQKAAFYLSWVLCPSNDDECQILANRMLELSHSWDMNNKKLPSYTYHTKTVNNRRKLRIPTVGDMEKLHVSSNPVSSLIKEFDDRCVKFCNIAAVSEVQDQELSYFPHSCPNFLHLRVPLGVLLVSSSCISEQDHDVLLHYTSTGVVLGSNEVQGKINDGFSASGRGFTERWALTGACLIFSWLDIIDEMSAVIFECEDTCHYFISQLRTKTGPYLLKCVNFLLNNAGQDKNIVIDLHDRLLNWNNIGQSFDGCEAFKEVILQINKTFVLS